MADLKRKSNIEIEYTKGNIRRDNFFGECFEYKSIKGNDSKICVEKLLNDKDAVIREIELRKKRMINNHEYLVNLLDYSVDVQTNWCSTFYLLKCFYEFVDKNLIAEILARKKMSGDKNRFKMEELTHLMYQQVHANCFLQERNIAHGDISPNTIFITPKGDFKIAFRMNDNMAPERVQVDKAIKNEPLYLSPSYYEAVKTRTLEKMKHNHHKSDMFALGLTILQTGLMRGVQDIYVGDKFDAMRLNDLLDEFQTQYEENPLLYTSVRKMCEVNEDERPDFVSLKSALPEYETIKDYFQKVEQGIYEDDIQEDANGYDSVKNYDAQYNYDQNDLIGNNHQSNSAVYNEEGQNVYGQQHQNVHQIYPGPGNNIPNFSRSISNKLSSSSNQNSKENSFNKPSPKNEFEHNGNSTNLHGNNNIQHQPNVYNQQGHNYADQHYDNDHHVSTQRTNQVYNQPPNNTYNAPNLGQIHSKDSYDQSHSVNPSSEVTSDFFNSDFFKYTPQTSVANTAYNYQNMTKDNYGNNITQPTIHSTLNQDTYDDYYFPDDEKVHTSGKDLQHAPPVVVNYNQQAHPYESPYINKPVVQTQHIYQQAPPVQNFFAENFYQTQQQPNSLSPYSYTPQNNNQTQPNLHVQRLPSQSAPIPTSINSSPYSNVYTPTQHQNNLPVQQSIGTPNGFTGQTKIIGGKLYNEVREETSSVENGVTVKKVFIKYVPSEQSVQPQVVQHLNQPQVQTDSQPNVPNVQRFVNSQAPQTYYTQGTNQTSGGIQYR